MEFGKVLELVREQWEPERTSRIRARIRTP